MNPKDEEKVIGLRKPNEVSKDPWEYRVRKMAKESQEKQMDQEWSRENK